MGFIGVRDMRGRLPVLDVGGSANLVRAIQYGSVAVSA